MPTTMLTTAQEQEIGRLLDVLYTGLRTSGGQCGIPLPPTPPADFYERSPLAQHLRYLAAHPADAGPSLRNLAAFLHHYPPTPLPLALPDWFWTQVPLLAQTLLTTHQWIGYPQATRLTGASYYHILDQGRKGILLSLYAPRQYQSERQCRYVWGPDLIAHYPDIDRAAVMDPMPKGRGLNPSIHDQSEHESAT